MNEELQSTNEELQTMNDELRTRGWTRICSPTEQSVFSSLKSGVVVLDRDFRIQVWNCVRRISGVCVRRGHRRPVSEPRHRTAVEQLRRPSGR